MLHKKIAALFMALITLISSIQNPVFATNFMIGQAFVAANELQEKKNLSVKPMELNNQENLIAEAVKEKQSMPVISSAQIYQTIVEKDEKEEKEEKEKEEKEKEEKEKEEKRQNKEFVNAVQKTDVTRLDLRKPSGLTDEKAEELLKGTGLEGLGKAFVLAEKRFHVNAYYLMAHAAWESGWGKSKISKEKNNLFGYMAYDHNPGLNAHGFKSKSEGIQRVAEYVSENYLNENGEYYRGAHLSGMNENYATDQSWKKGIASVIVLLADKTEEINRSQAA